MTVSPEQETFVWFATRSWKPIARGHTLISYAACCGTLIGEPGFVRALGRNSDDVYYFQPNSDQYKAALEWKDAHPGIESMTRIAAEKMFRQAQP